MSNSKGYIYESLCHELINGLMKHPSFQEYRLGSGARNRITGASGYRHQIDLSLNSKKQLYIFELKCLEKSIGVAEILVLAARLNDISAVNPNLNVRASIISTKRPSRNVAPLAKQFGLSVEVIENLNSYGITFANQHFIGHVEKANAQDYCDASVIRGNGGD